LEKIPALDTDIIGKLYNAHKVYKSLIDLVYEFKSILKGDDASVLAARLNKALALGIDEITSFANGILRDLPALMNAITYEYSNGLAEGKVNKLKLFKRVMYGRCSFELLRNKVISAH